MAAHACRNHCTAPLGADQKSMAGMAMASSAPRIASNVMLNSVWMYLRAIASTRISGRMRWSRKGCKVLEAKVGKEGTG